MDKVAHLIGALLGVGLIAFLALQVNPMLIERCEKRGGSPITNAIGMLDRCLEFNPNLRR